MLRPPPWKPPSLTSCTTDPHYFPYRVKFIPTLNPGQTEICWNFEDSSVRQKHLFIQAFCVPGPQLPVTSSQPIAATAASPSLSVSYLYSASSRGSCSWSSPQAPRMLLTLPPELGWLPITLAQLESPGTCLELVYPIALIVFHNNTFMKFSYTNTSQRLTKQKLLKFLTEMHSLSLSV